MEIVQAGAPSAIVTILIPTYKRADYLREAIQSALAQTYSAIEILVLDDASPDETPAVVAEFANEPRLRCIRHAQNVGIAENWRRGIAACRGDFFCLLHDDDTLEPDFVARLAPPLQHDPALVVSFCDHWVVNAQGERLPAKTQATTARFRRDRLTAGKLTDFAHAALVNGSLCAGAALFRRSQLGPECIRVEAQGAIDMWLFYRCVKTGGGAYYVPERLMNYRSHAGGMSSASGAYMAEGHLFCCRHILADPQMQAIHAPIRRMMATTQTNLGIHLLTAAKLKEARQALRTALQMQRSRRAMAAYVLAYGGALGVKTANALRAKEAVSG